MTYLPRLDVPSSILLWSRAIPAVVIALRIHTTLISVALVIAMRVLCNQGMTSPVFTSLHIHHLCNAMRMCYTDEHCPYQNPMLWYVTVPSSCMQDVSFGRLSPCARQIQRSRQEKDAAVHGPERMQTSLSKCHCICRDIDIHESRDSPNQYGHMQCAKPWRNVTCVLHWHLTPCM